MSTFNALPSLPLDLFQIIFEEMAAEAQAGDEEFDSTLCSCLLVSNFFRLLALPHIFHHIRIGTLGLNLEQFKEHVLKLLQILSPPGEAYSHIPEVAPHVRSFTFSIMDPGNHSMEDSVRLSLLQSIVAHKNLALVLRRFRSEEYGIQSFTVHIALDWHKTPSFRYLLDSGVNWTDFSLDFRVAFQYLVNSPYLQRLSMENVHGFPLTILQGSYLKSLELSKQSSQSQKEAAFYPGPEHLAYPALEELDLARFKLSLFDRVKYGSLLRNIKNLSLPMDDSVEMMKFVMLARESVQVLCVRHFHLDSYPASFNLGFMSNLASFSLTHYLSSHYPHVNNNERIITGLNQILDVPHPMRHFENLELFLAFTTDELGENITKPFSGIEKNWIRFVEILSSPVYPVLNHIGINICLLAKGYPIDDPEMLDQTPLRQDSAAFLAQCFERLPKSVSLNIALRTYYLS